MYPRVKSGILLLVFTTCFVLVNAAVGVAILESEAIIYGNNSSIAVQYGKFGYSMDFEDVTIVNADAYFSQENTVKHYVDSYESTSNMIIQRIACENECVNRVKIDVEMSEEPFNPASWLEREEKHNVTIKHRTKFPAGFLPPGFSNEPSYKLINTTHYRRQPLPGVQDTFFDVQELFFLGEDTLVRIVLSDGVIIELNDLFKATMSYSPPTISNDCSDALCVDTADLMFVIDASQNALNDVTCGTGDSQCFQVSGGFGHFNRSFEECCLYLNWDLYFLFIIDVITPLKLGEYGYRTGITLYRDTAQVVLPLGSHSKSYFLDQLNTIRSINVMGGCHDVTTGLSVARDHFDKYGRNGRNKKVMIVNQYHGSKCDGFDSNDNITNTLESEGFTIHSISIGSTDSNLLPLPNTVNITNAIFLSSRVLPIISPQICQEVRSLCGPTCKAECTCKQECNCENATCDDTNPCTANECRSADEGCHFPLNDIFPNVGSPTSVQCGSPSFCNPDALLHAPFALCANAPIECEYMNGPECALMAAECFPPCVSSDICTISYCDISTRNCVTEKRVPGSPAFVCEEGGSHTLDYCDTNTTNEFPVFNKFPGCKAVNLSDICKEQTPPCMIYNPNITSWHLAPFQIPEAPNQTFYNPECLYEPDPSCFSDVLPLVPTTIPPTTSSPTTTPPTTLPPTTSAPPTSATIATTIPSSGAESSGSSVVVIVVACVVAFLLLFVVAGLFICNYHVRGKRKGQPQVTSMTSASLKAGEDAQVSPYGFLPERLSTVDVNLKSVNINYEDLIFGKQLGEGSFGSVMQAEYKGKNVAVKISSLGAEENQNFLREVEVNMSLDPHPNIVGTFGLCFLDGKPMLVLEFMANGSLEELYNTKEDDFTFNETKTFLSSIAAGMTFLHKNKIIHRDLACRNILISEDNVLKISDFGMSRKSAISGKAQETKNGIGPIRWMSPESMRKLYEPKSDVWSFGMVMYELIYRTIPFGEVDDLFDLAVRIRDKGYTPELDDRVHQQWKSIMDNCWAFSSSDRPTFNKLKTSISSATQFVTNE